MDSVNRTDPTPVSVTNMLPGSGATGTYFNVQAVHIPVPASGGSLVAWINPESGTVAARASYYFVTAGTGTVDVGRTDDGTASSDTIINAGTMLAGLRVRPDAASSTAGAAGLDFLLVGPGGTGTNNSITLSHDEAATGTAVGGLIIEYFPIGR